MNFVELNKFSEIHDDKNIFFCKTDFILDEFKKIEYLPNDVVLITGNSDYPIEDRHVSLMPKNIKKWYGQNILSNHEKLIPIPLGLENKLESKRFGHGIGYLERATIKETLLLRKNNTPQSKKIYSNFNISTNFYHRNHVKEICQNLSYVDWEEPNLSIEDFFNKILNYEMIVCPAGNGVDTHRLWEVLYSDRIPITIKIGNYKIYELYEKFPIVILDSINDLGNEKLIYEKYKLVKQKKYNIEELYCDYWIEKIKNEFL